MTCFWNGNLQALRKIINSDDQQFGFIHKCSPAEFVEYLVKNATKTPNVLWNNEILLETQLFENLEWIQSYNISSINNGHDCSVCDPFLLLIVHLFCVNIHHRFNGHLITYNIIDMDSVPVIHVSSNNGHFWAD